MPRVSHGFSTLGLMALLVSLASCDGATGDRNGPSNTPPDAAFTPSCALLVCTFADGSSDADGQVTAYTWNFGDGAEATTQNSTHAYGSAGTYVVALTVTDDGGASGNFSRQVTVTGSQTGGPTADFAASCVFRGRSGRTVLFDCTFTDQSTAAAGTTVTAWAWEFGDGRTSTEQNPPGHPYTISWWTLSVAVTLTVTDNNGLTNGVTQSVQIPTPANAPPTADFTSLCTNLACSFTDLSADGDGTIVGFHWDFGDGAVGATQNPAHLYPSTGTYIVELTVTDDDGATGHFSQQVTVTGSQSGGPTADFAGSCVRHSAGNRILIFDCTFTDQSTAAPGATVTAWAWDFGDGRTSTEQNPPVHHYVTVGTPVPWTVRVRLTVTDSNGLTSDVTKPVH